MEILKLKWRQKQIKSWRARPLLLPGAWLRRGDEAGESEFDEIGQGEKEFICVCVLLLVLYLHVIVIIIVIIICCCCCCVCGCVHQSTVHSCATHCSDLSCHLLIFYVLLQVYVFVFILSQPLTWLATNMASLRDWLMVSFLGK